MIDENEEIRLKINRRIDLSHYLYFSSGQYFLITNQTKGQEGIYGSVGGGYNTLRLVVRDNSFINILSGSQPYYMSNSYSLLVKVQLVKEESHQSFPNH